MSQLTIYSSEAPDQAQEVLTDQQAIASQLREVGVTFEQWQTRQPVAPQDDHKTILAAYSDSIERLKAQGGYQTADVVSLYPDHPDKEQFRAKFLNEHTHSEDEVRFFVHGKGVFYLHIDRKIYAVLCEQGDLISVPKGVTHWFDMGSLPEFTCIRLFTDPAGWVAAFTGSNIAAKTPNMDAIVAR